MSYGWLTEASILPKPAIPIHVDDSSINAMKIALLKEKQNEKMGIFKAKQKNKQEKKINKGVEQRMAKDLKDNAVDSDQNKLNNLKQILSKKAEIYEKSKQAGISVKNSLIDFQLKQLNDMDNNEQNEYEQLREQFIQTKKNELSKIHSDLLNERPQLEQPQLGFNHNQQELERIQWEQQMINELESDLKQSNEQLKERAFIEQSYDKKLTMFEKEKLSNVLQEEQESKIKLIEICRKRKEAQDARNEKLKKLIKK